MNFLAHFLLAKAKDGWIVGNFLADFTKGNDLTAFPQEIQEGIRLHRAIDSYTDQHPEVLKGVRRLYDRHSKYAPVLVDIYYDFILSRNWETYADKSLRDFTLDIYEVLNKNILYLPAPLNRRFEMMYADDWLMKYAQLEGMRFTFQRMQYRVSKPELMEDAVESLQLHFNDLNEEFNRFFPDLQAYVKSHVSKMEAGHS